MHRRLIINVPMILCLAASTALGHPGHGTTGDGGTPQHYLVEPMHVAQWVIVVAVSIAMGRFVAKCKANCESMDTENLN